MQYSFFKKQSSEHGGELAKGRRRGVRPLARRKPTHFVLKARGNLYRHRALVQPAVRAYAEKFGHRVYGVAVAHDHVHFALLILNRDQYRKFIRALTARLAKILGRGLWKLSPFSRVVEWGRDFKNLLRYLALNRAEASGEIPY